MKTEKDKNNKQANKQTKNICDSFGTIVNMLDWWLGSFIYGHFKKYRKY